MKKSLPIKVADYLELQQNDYYVVDKSLIIEEFLLRKSKATIITRPRRFGKSFNMSMMADFFDITKDSMEIFKDTKIAKTPYIQKINQYPTISLSFAYCYGDYKLLCKSLFETLCEEYGKYRKLFESDEFDEDIVEKVRKNYQALKEGTDISVIGTSLRSLSKFLYEVYGKKVMIFIDEYDTPFMEAHVNGYYDEIKNELSLLLQSTLKDNKYLEYAMLTGIQRVSKENIFSRLNNVVVYTVKDKEYAPYFGFTKEETKVLLEYYGLVLNDKVKAMYDGYNMGGIDIYNPWSIINYASKKELIPFWVNTSSNTMMKEAIKKSDTLFKKGYENLIEEGYLDTEVHLATSFFEVRENRNLWGLLVNAGYLTIEYVIDLENEEYRLRIPNCEVLSDFKSITANYLHVQIAVLSSLFKGLIKKDKQKFLDAYRDILLKNPSYHDLKDENSYHMFLLGICLYMKDEYEIISNREAGTGRCDIILQAKTNQVPSYVLEFKYCNEEKTDLQTLAKVAVDQIKSRKYDCALTGEVIYIGLAHYGKVVEMNWSERDS